MSTYLWRVNYTESGAQGLINEGGTGRCAAIREMVESVGGKVHGCYFALVDHHLYVIGEVPDDVAAATLSVWTTASGVARSDAIPLLSPEQMDVAVRRSVTYQSPGSFQQ